MTRAPTDRGEGDVDRADRLLSLLYGELDAVETERERVRIAADPALVAELAGLEGVRSAFRALPEEEPAAGSSAKLLTEAARVASGVRRGDPAPGLWASLVAWMAPVTRHPGLAAAASLVLVATVAGALYLRRGDELGRAGRKQVPAAADQRPAPAASTPVADEQAADPETVERAAPPAERAPLREKKKGHASADDKVLEARTRESTKPGSVESGTVRGIVDPESKQELESDDGRNAAGEGVLGAAGGSPAQVAAPEPTTPAGPKDSNQYAPRAEPPSAGELHARAVSAAAEKRCSDVRSLASELRALDPAYFKSTFARDKRLTACLESPSVAPSQSRSQKTRK